MKKIVLVGTPNSGKSTLFNALTGLNQKVGNFPGVTVERKASSIDLDSKQKAKIVDLPGINSLYPNSEDEQITFNVLSDSTHPDYPDLVLMVVDATQLHRGLLLSSQVIDLGLPTLLVINMLDLVQQESLLSSVNHWAEELGLGVVGISARHKKGIKEIKEAMNLDIGPSSQKVFKVPSAFQDPIQNLQKEFSFQNEYLAYQALLSPEQFTYLGPDQQERISTKSKVKPGDVPALISNELLVRNDFIHEKLAAFEDADQANKGEKLSQKLDRILTHKLWGYLIFVGLLVLIFQALFKWSEYPMGWIEGATEWLISGVETYLPEGFLRDLLTEGVITGFGGIVIFIPQIAFLFLFITLMEESGYMARVVFLMDRIMRPFGFSGKSVIPLMGGMACAIPSIMMSRNISNKTERLITILVTPLMSCSARIPVFILLIAMFVPAGNLLGFDQRGLFMTGLYFLGFFAALGMAFVFKKILRYQSNGTFVMEMPMYRVPRWKNVGMTVYQKSLAFVFGAGKIILAITIILWLLLSFGPAKKMQSINEQYDGLITQETDSLQIQNLERERNGKKLEASFASILGHAIEPVIRPLGYDWKIGISLIASFAAREVFVGTMSIIYGKDDPDSAETDEGIEAGRLSLIDRLQEEKDPQTGKAIYTKATVFSLIIFYVFAMQCMSTLAITKKEIGWKWTGVMLLYLTLLAYICAFIGYQIFS